MTVTRQMLRSELKDLLRLTAFEQTVATVRRAQARSSPIERELAENAQKAGERLRLLQSAVASLGGVPDVVTPAMGRIGAFLQGQVNQVQTLQGALLGDLALEHQLRERARYARTLAQSLGEQQVLPVLDRLETAHTATIDWLETRLAEVGRTGTSALRATPVQVAVTAVRRSAGAPLGALAAGVNRATGAVARLTGKAPRPLQDVLADLEDTAARVSDRVIDLTERGAQAAKSVGGRAGATEQALEATGGADVEDGKPPFAGYDTLTGDSVMRHVADTDDVEQLRTLLAYEQAHKARKGVLSAVQERLQALATG